MKNNDIIDSVVNKEVDVSAHKFQSPVVNILDQNAKDPVENKIKKYLRSAEMISDYYSCLHDGICANPSKEDVVTAFNSSYVLFKDSEGERNNIINTELGMSEFYNRLTVDNIIKMIYIKGAKGTGKTSFLNYFLNNYTRKMERTDKTIWYRVDVTKIYDEWKSLNESERENKISLLGYLSVQIPFVTLKYEKQSIAFSNILEKINKNKAIYKAMEVTKKEGVNLSKDSIRDVLTDITGKISWQASYRMVKKAKELGYRICVFIDGIDNIDFRRNKLDYEEILKQLIGIFHTSNRESIVDKYIISIRGETYAHLRKRKPVFFRHKNSYECFTIEPVNLHTLLEKKACAAEEPKGMLIHSKNVNHTNNILKKEKEKEAEEGNEKGVFFEKYDTFQAFDKSFVDYSKKYTNRLITAFKNTLSKSPIQDQNDLLIYLANNNIRDFTINFVNSYRMWLLFERKSNNVPDDSRVLESLILNGRRYVDSMSSDNEQSLGYLLPNIFWFNSNESNGVWHGLCGYRILRYLNTPLKPEKDAIVSFLKREFKYNNSIVKERLNSFLKFGLVTFQSTSDNKNILYQITKKGKFLLLLTFSNIDVFYHFSLDTPLVAGRVGIELDDFDEFDTKEIEYHHRTGDNLWDGYLSSSIRTSCTLLRHILSYDKKELNEIADKKHEEMFKVHQDYYAPLITGMSNKLERLKEVKRDIYEKMLLDFEGILDIKNTVNLRRKV